MIIKPQTELGRNSIVCEPDTCIQIEKVKECDTDIGSYTTIEFIRFEEPVESDGYLRLAESKETTIIEDFDVVNKVTKEVLYRVRH